VLNVYSPCVCYDNILHSMVKSALLKTQNTILSAASVLAIASGISALLGFVKARVLTSYFGVSDELAIFYTADRIPNLIYSILVVGALSTIFIPVFTQTFKKDPEQAWKTSSSMINSSILFFVLMGSLIFLLASPIIRLLSVGQFSVDQINLGANLMRIMLMAQMILVVSSFITCVLQSFKYFLIPALAPVLYSLGIILGTVFLSGEYGIYGPAFGVAIGSVLHLMIQAPLLKRVNFKFSLTLDLKNRGLKDIFSLMPPRILSVAMASLLSTINNSLAILISAPSVVFLKFAGQLQFFPVSLVGVSIASAILPTLSKETDEEGLHSFKKTFITSLHQMLFLVMPISMILFILRIPVVRIVYGVANFPWEATVMTAYTLAFFSISIFAQSSIYLITRAFYSLRDTKTPVLVSIVTILLNVSISLFFIRVMGFGVWSIALAFSITSIIDMVVLLALLYRKIGGFDINSLLVPFTKISYAALFMGLSLYIPLKFLDQYVFDTTRTLNLLILTGIAGVAGMAAYLFFTKVFKVEEVQLFYKLLRKIKIMQPEPQPVVSVEHHAPHTQ
jgi:putative peptidoglycan lipid II flippase